MDSITGNTLFLIGKIKRKLKVDQWLNGSKYFSVHNGVHPLAILHCFKKLGVFRKSSVLRRHSDRLLNFLKLFVINFGRFCDLS